MPMLKSVHDGLKWSGVCVDCVTICCNLRVTLSGRFTSMTNKLSLLNITSFIIENSKIGRAKDKEKNTIRSKKLNNRSSGNVRYCKYFRVFLSRIQCLISMFWPLTSFRNNRPNTGHTQFQGRGKSTGEPSGRLRWHDFRGWFFLFMSSQPIGSNLNMICRNTN
jgi:hypothetical protein